MSGWLARLVLGCMRGHGPARPVRHRMVGMIFRHWPGMITCAQFERFILDYHEGELPDASRTLFERHLGVCGLCRSSYQGYVRSIELGRRLFADDPDAPVPEAVPAGMVAAVVAALRKGR